MLKKCYILYFQTYLTKLKSKIMTVNLSIENDNELRLYVKDLIRGQIKSLVREELMDLVKEEINKKIAAKNEAWWECEMNRIIQRKTEKYVIGELGKIGWNWKHKIEEYLCTALKPYIEAWATNKETLEVYMENAIQKFLKASFVVK